MRVADVQCGLVAAATRPPQVTMWPGPGRSGLGACWRLAHVSGCVAVGWDATLSGRTSCDDTLRQKKGGDDPVQEHGRQKVRGRAWPSAAFHAAMPLFPVLPCNPPPPRALTHLSYITRGTCSRLDVGLHPEQSVPLHCWQCIMIRGSSSGAPRPGRPSCCAAPCRVHAHAGHSSMACQPRCALGACGARHGQQKNSTQTRTMILALREAAAGCSRNAVR